MGRPSFGALARRIGILCAISSCALPACRSTAPDQDPPVSVVNHPWQLHRCEWVAGLETLSSAGTPAGLHLMKLKASRLGANAILLSGVLPGGPQGAHAFKCEKRPVEELPY